MALFFILCPGSSEHHNTVYEDGPIIISKPLLC